MDQILQYQVFGILHTHVARRRLKYAGRRAYLIKNLISAHGDLRAAHFRREMILFL